MGTVSAQRPIHAIPRFGLLAACAVMLGDIALEGQVALAASMAGMVTGGATTVAAFTQMAPLMMVSKLLACAVVTWAVLVLARQSWRDLGHVGFRPPELAAPFFLIIAGTIVFLSEIDNLIRAITPDGLDALNWAPHLGELVSAPITGPLLAVIIGPLVEEIIFRGIILRGLLGKFRPWAAIGLSALLFAVMHFNPAQFPIALLLGAVLGWVYVRTRSLGLCFFAHALNNASGYITHILPFEVQGFNAEPPENFTGTIFHPWWFDLAGLALFAAGVCWIHLRAARAAPWTLPPADAAAAAVEAAQTAVTPPPVPAPVGLHAAPPSLAAPYPTLPGAAPALPLPPGAPTNSFCAPPVLADAGRQMSSDLVQLVTSLAHRARAAALALATIPPDRKNAALQKLADLIDASHTALLEANVRDLTSAEAAALTPAARERLALSEKKLQQLAASVREVIALPDPVGELLEETVRPNGLKIRKLRVPIGVIGIIYEARPNVTIDCAILCLKSGNASILRGGKECFHTNTALADLIQRALAETGLPRDAVQLIPTTDRAALNTLLKLDTLIHCVIPRGGESLIRYVAQNSTIPVIKHYKGVCFVYADAAADLAMAEAITVNAKTSRPSVCNAAEQLLVHRSIAEAFLPQVARALVAKNVELRCDMDSAVILARAGLTTTPASKEDFTTEFLDTVIAVRVVDSLDAAIATINRDSSNHSDAIVTADEAAARRFLAEVDSATVYWNASTRFTDGFEFGYGAEIGISTDRLHARGPMGLRELCSYKFVIEGTGQVR